MRFQIKKILEGFDPADLIEQSMYCFGSDSSDNDNSGGDEAMEVQQRYFDQETGVNRGNSQNLSAPSTTGYASDELRDNYIAGQTALANKIASGQSLNEIGIESRARNEPYSYDDYIANQRATNRDQLVLNPNHITGSAVSDISLGRVPQTQLNKTLEGIARFALPMGIGNFIPTYDQRQNQLGRDIISGKGSAIFNNDGVITGINRYDNNENNDDNSSQITVAPTRNPISGQPVCPDGYRYDDDLQACRLDTSSQNRSTNPNPFPSGDAYYRATSLDQAPVNAPSGFDFNSANQNFIDDFAYRPANFTNQMGLNGFTPFRRS